MQTKLKDLKTRFRKIDREVGGTGGGPLEEAVANACGRNGMEEEIYLFIKEFFSKDLLNASANAVDSGRTSPLPSSLTSSMRPQTFSSSPLPQTLSFPLPQTSSSSLPQTPSPSPMTTPFLSKAPSATSQFNLKRKSDPLLLISDEDEIPLKNMANVGATYDADIGVDEDDRMKSPIRKPFKKQRLNEEGASAIGDSEGDNGNDKHPPIKKPLKNKKGNPLYNCQELQQQNNKIDTIAYAFESHLEDTIGAIQGLKNDEDIDTERFKAQCELKKHAMLIQSKERVQMEELRVKEMEHKIKMTEMKLRREELMLEREKTMKSKCQCKCLCDFSKTKPEES